MGAGAVAVVVAGVAVVAAIVLEAILRRTSVLGTDFCAAVTLPFFKSLEFLLLRVKSLSAQGKSTLHTSAVQGTVPISPLFVCP